MVGVYQKNEHKMGEGAVSGSVLLCMKNISENPAQPFFCSTWEVITRISKKIVTLYQVKKRSVLYHKVVSMNFK